MNDFKKIISTLTVNPYGEEYLYGINGNLFHKIDSTSIFNNKFPKNFLEKNSLYVITGTDSGLFLNYIIKNNIPSGTKIIFIEFQEIIEWIYNKKEFSLPKSISLINPEQLEEQLEKFDADKYIYIDNINHITSFGAIYCHCENYLSLNKNIIKNLQDLNWKTKAQLNNKLFIINQLQNLPYNINHASILYGQFRDQSALLLAGGPSLDLCIPWIQNHKDRFVIIAVSRIARRLINASIIPDIIVSVDPQDISFDLSRDMFHFAETSLFIHSYHAFHPMVAQWPGRKAYLGALFPWNSPLNIPDKGSGSGGVTVTNVALECALKMGFPQIVLCGVDLCYSPEGNTHASFSKNSEEGPVLEGSETTIETNSGLQADTTFAYETAARHIEHLASHEISSKSTLINPNIHAAKMKGVLFKELCQIEFSEITKNNKIHDFDFSENFSIHFKNVSNELITIKNKLNKIITLSNKAIIENRKFFKKIENRIKNTKNKIDEIEKIFQSEKYKDVSHLVKTFGIEYFLKIISIKDSTSLKEKEAEDYLNQYYNSFIKSSKYLIKLINNAIHYLNITGEERSQNPDYKALVNHWKMNNIPGRVQIFEKNNYQAFSDSPTSVKEEYLALKNLFIELIQGKENYSKIFNQQWFPWTEGRRNNFIKKIINIYQNKDTYELEQIIDKIKKINKKELNSIIFFTMGLLNELNNHYVQTIESYNKSIENGEETDRLLLEHALKRIASVSISHNDYENSLLALKCLNDLSIEYAPQYAKLLKLTGNQHDALDVYARYIERCPNDLERMLEMASLYYELEIWDGVKLLTDVILEKDPGNKTAQQLREANA